MYASKMFGCMPPKYPEERGADQKTTLQKKQVIVY
jgi:hypothetical protein